MRHHSLLFKPLWLMSHAAILALEAINLETEGNIKHAGIFFPKLPFLFEFCSTSVRTHRLFDLKVQVGLFPSVLGLVFTSVRIEDVHALRV